MSELSLPKVLYELNLRLSKGQESRIDFIKQLLCLCGIPRNEIIEIKVKDCWHLSVFFDSPFKGKRFSRELRRLKLKGIEIHFHKKLRNQWLENWKKGWKPFRLTKDLDVVPAWTRERYKKGKRDFVILDTVTSFGTGLHETTKFMAQFIVDQKGSIHRFLDIGTGTGILSLIAFKCGARQVEAIDISDTAVDTAQQNLKANGFKFDMVRTVDLKEFKSTHHFDYVAANLISHDLMEMKDRICALVARGGCLAISGVSLEKLPAVLKEYRTLPLDLVQVVKGKKWSAALFKKRG